MLFENQTPFPGLAFEGLDQHDQSFWVVVLRITYDLHPGPGRVPLTAQATHHLLLSDEPTPLAEVDTFLEAPHHSPLLWESDFAPHKPNCDVLIRAQAHAPGKAPLRSFEVALRLEAQGRHPSEPENPRALNPQMEPSQEELDLHRARVAEARTTLLPGEVLLDRKLRILGPRVFRRKRFPIRLVQGLLRLGTLGILRGNPWKLTRPAPIRSLALDYTHAYGGRLVIPLKDPQAAKRVPHAHRLPEDRREELALPEPLAAYSQCDANPLGKGHATPWAVKALKCKELPAPQIEIPGKPITARHFWKALKAKPRKPYLHPSLEPAGFGPVGRGWPHRKALAGTYDQAWLEERHPLLPSDFDFAYWNCAHPSMQCRTLDGNEILTLLNMGPKAPEGFLPEDGTLRFALPGHKPFVLTRFEDGTLGTLPLKTDTLIVDLEEKQVIQVVRGTLMRTQPVRALELRMKLNRDAMPSSMLAFAKETA